MKPLEQRNSTTLHGIFHAGGYSARRYPRIILIILVSLLFAMPLTAQDLATHVYIRGLQTASPPVYQLESDSMVFTYQAQNFRYQPRSVGVSFGFEQYAVVHEMQYFDRRDDQGNLLSRVYFYFLPISTDIEKKDSIEYRYVVDGIWMEDPSNPQYSEKISGRRVSVANLPKDREVPPVSPEITPRGENSRSKLVKFRFFADSGQQIYLAGSFNNWDPFMYRLDENPLNPGEYELTLRLLPGEYHYNYYFRGRRIKDPLNVRSSYDIEGYEYSTFSVGS